MRQPHDSTLICTLGGQPQIVTLMLDLLLAHTPSIHEIIVLYLWPDERMINSLEKLRSAFNGRRYQGHQIRLRRVPIERDGEILPAIQSEADAELTRQIVHNLINTLKGDNQTIHLCIAGGPRLMGLMALSVVTMHCGHEDKVWHLHSEPDFWKQSRGGQQMHDEAGGQTALIPVPMVPWGAYFPALRMLYQSPTELLQAQTHWLDDTERHRCQEVIDKLSNRERDVLKPLAQGHTPQIVAEQLNISIKTVDSHKTEILAECRVAWSLADDARLDYHFLRERFGAFWNQASARH